MHIVSINAASRQNLVTRKKPKPTGIFKQPLSGPVRISARGIHTDFIADAKVHGGLDQALYLYSEADYQWWAEALGREMLPGTFGENLTLSAFPEQPLQVGDRLTINDVVLEITAPRVPCSKLAAKMGDGSFGKKFVAAVRPGAYARVLQPGTITAGDAVAWQPTAASSVTLNDIFIEWHKKNWSRELFRKALDTPISMIYRDIIESRYLR